MTKIVIGIPTRNEAKNIGSLVKMIDDTLARLHLPANGVMIVNADSASTDGTVDVFRQQPTNTPKTVIQNDLPGKGRNIQLLVSFAAAQQAQLILIDGDIRSFEHAWIVQMLGKLETGFDFIVPCYARYEIEGNTTNHFAYPLLFSFFGGAAPRQPIAGDFALSDRFVQFLNRHSFPTFALAYGVDIYLTIQALLYDFSVAEVELGSKIHNPSFPKMESMFEEVCESALGSLVEHMELLNADIPSAGSQVSKKQVLIPYKTIIPETARDALTSKNAAQAKIRRPDLYGMYVVNHGLNATGWAGVLRACLLSLKSDNVASISKDIVPFFILRSTTYLSSIYANPHFSAEAELEHQVKLIQNALRS